MRLWLFLLSVLPALFSVVEAQEPFPGAAPVTLRFREMYRDQVVREPGTDPADEMYLVGGERTILIEGTAPLEGFDITQLDENSAYAITVGNFDSGLISGLQGKLGDDPTFDPATDTAINVPIYALNFEGQEVEVGSIGLNWDTTQVEITVSIGNLNQPLTEIDEEIGADFYRELDVAAIDADFAAGFTFGPFSFELRNAYAVGTASTSTDDRVVDVLSNVTLEGAIDSILPTLTMTHPATNTSTTAIETYTVTGTVVDTRKIFTNTFPNEVELVEVRVGTAADPGEFVEAMVEERNDDLPRNWSLADVTLEPGENFITARAVDVDGNVIMTSSRKVTFLTSGPITVRAVAEGYTAPQPNVVAGSVSGPVFAGTNQIVVLQGGAPVEGGRTNLVAGQSLTVTAKPGPGSVFNGWTATLEGVELFTAATEVLTFETRPNLELEATFVPNPFEAVLGVYHGIVTGDNPAERGLFRIGISKTGAFSGKVQVGTVILPMKGKVLGSGFWTGEVRKGATVYTVSFQLDVTPGGDSQLAGKVTGGGITADFTGDLKDWRNARGTNPGKLASAFMTLGGYNVVLPGSGANVPEGIGFGRVTVTKLGGVLFVGKLGDGSPVKGSSTLVAPNSGGVFFPLYVGLDNRLGSVSGVVEYDGAQGLTGTLDWQEPATNRVEPQAFEGQIELEGALYMKPAAGTAVITPEGGGTEWGLELSAPAYTVPAVPAGAPFGFVTAATLSGTAVVPADGSTRIRMKFNGTNGLFSGSYRDASLGKTIPFAGAALRFGDGAGFARGVFVRGNRAGAVKFEAAGH